MSEPGEPSGPTEPVTSEDGSPAARPSGLLPPDDAPTRPQGPPPHGYPGPGYPMPQPGAQPPQPGPVPPAAGQPPYGQPQYGQPQYGQPPYAAPPNAQPQYAPPSYPGPGYPPVPPPGYPQRSRPRGQVVGFVAAVVAVVALLLGGGFWAARATDDRHDGQPAPTSASGPSPTGTPDPSEGSSPSGPPSDSPSGPSGPTGPAAGGAWTVPVNSYCRQADKQLKAVPKARIEDFGPKMAPALRQFAGAVRTMNTRLHAMQPPADRKADYDAMLAAWDQVPVANEQAAAAADKADRVAFNAAIARAGAANDKGNAIAERLGLTDCAGAGGLPENGASPTPSPLI